MSSNCLDFSLLSNPHSELQNAARSKIPPLLNISFALLQSWRAAYRPTQPKPGTPQARQAIYTTEPEGTSTNEIPSIQPARYQVSIHEINGFDEKTSSFLLPHKISRRRNVPIVWTKPVNLLAAYILSQFLPPPNPTLPPWGAGASNHVAGI